MEFDKYSKKYIHYYSDELPRLLMKLVADNKGAKAIADLGCGDGSILYALNKKGLLAHFNKVYAVDLSEERINKVKQISNKIDALVSDVCNLHELKNNEIDIIISNQIIEHVTDCELMIKEMVRILNKNGTIYLTTVFKKWYGWYFHKDKRNKWVIDPTHEREYTEDSQLLDCLKEHNLEIMDNRKSLHWFALSDFILKRIGFKQDIYEKSIFFKLIRKIKVPILGYYNWEIVCRKR